MIGKVVVTVTSVLLVVGIAIGVVGVVSTHGKAKEDKITPQMKAVKAICQPTSDQTSCVKTLAPVNSDDPKKLIKAFMVATEESVKRAYNFIIKDALKIDPKNPSEKAVVDYCKKVFNYALEDLKSILDGMGNDLQHVGDKFYDLKQWLTSVYVYQSDCLNDAVDLKDLQQRLANGTADAKTLTSNAVDIFNKIVDILAPYGQQLNLTSLAASAAAAAAPSRRLLEDSTTPSWMSGADRKLLAKAGRGGGETTKPTFVVAKDKSGQFATVSQAVAACPEKNLGRCVIYIKAGVYNEQVIIPKKKNNIFMYGDGARKTVITFNRSVKLSPGTTTSLSATVQVESEGFMAKYIGFKNTAGPDGHQAVAIRVNGDKAVLFNCRMDGYQDTLYVDSGRQFYRNCVISGTIDFIFGMSAATIQNSLIVVRRGNPNQFNTVTADGNEKGPALHIGIVIQNCRIVADKKLEPFKLTTKSYLGRPWKAYSTTIIMNSEIGDVIHPEGWMIWQGQNFHTTSVYKEFNNRGPGAAGPARPNWVKVARNPMEIQDFTVENWLKPLDWIQASAVPFLAGL